jgi:hypothetical protein
MTAILDILAATIAGTMIILTIIVSIFNISQVNYNVSMFLAMNTHAQKVIEVLNDVYLENTGKYMETADGAAIGRSLPDALTIRSRLEHFSPTATEFRFDVVPAGGGGFVLEVTDETGMVVYDTLPYHLTTQNVFTYFDENNVLIADPVANSADIRVCRVDLEFFTPGLGNIEDLELTYPITFWRYFKNLYLPELKLITVIEPED